MSDIECIWPVGAELGEGVLWSPEENAVWFVDIIGLRVHRMQLESGEKMSWSTPLRPGFVTRLEGAGWLVGLADGLYRFDPETGQFTLLTPVGTDLPQNRINDGGVGPDGILWFGSKNKPEDEASGVWYRWTGSGEPEAFDSGYLVTNGPAFSPDGRTMYHCDTTERRILARDISFSGKVGENNLFAMIEEGAGYPDGLAVDVDGCLWVALYGGSAIRRYSPAGVLLQEIGLPCNYPTKPAFGGSDGLTLFVTSARFALSADERPIQTQDGGLFAVRVDVRGVPIPAFRLGSGRTG